MNCVFEAREPGRACCKNCVRCVPMRCAGPERIIAQNCGERPQPTAQAPTSGPGTELSKLLASIGIAEGNCSCAQRIAQMNAWGPDGCREHREEIVGWLREAATERSWGEKVAAAAKAVQTGLAFELNWSDPFPSLVDEAIRRAELPA